jgi:hypothetical protein
MFALVAEYEAGLIHERTQACADRTPTGPGCARCSGTPATVT